MDQRDLNELTRVFREAAGLSAIVKPRIFVSYHHGGDQYYCEQFSQNFSVAFELFTDRSLSEPFRSNDTDYVYRQIRERHISGTSMTVVLCGTQTGNRKYVDWEIKATLDKCHALLAIILPDNPQRYVPSRLHENIQTGYANWIDWTLNAYTLRQAMQESLARAKQNRRAIVNNRPMMTRNT